MKSTHAKLGKYAFFLGTAASALVGHADAQSTVADFTFETSGLAISTSTPAESTSPLLLAEVGSGTAVGVHAGAAVYSSPAGNGSLHSFSSNVWAAGDYYQFTINATGYSALTVAFDAVSSGTGPKAFTLAYSTDGTTFTNFGAYTLNTGTATAFASGTSNTAVNYSFNLSAITGLNNATDVFRLVESDTTTATGGTSRVDNFIETGSAAPGAVPEPSSVALLSIAGAGAVFAARRRKRA